VLRAELRNTAVSRQFGPRRKYCSTACRQRSYRARVRAREKAVRGELITSAPRTATSASGALGTDTGVPLLPGPTSEALRKRAERETWARFGLEDLLDLDQAEPGEDTCAGE
jgi:hypothetical protein